MKPITRCRVSGSTNLIPILNLGTPAMTGIFPLPGEHVPSGPLELLWCPESDVLQLSHQFDRDLLFGPTYGYRSGLNKMMVAHLQEKARHLESFTEPGDVVLDIGSNDGTLLNAISPDRIRIGMDPTIAKFGQYYDADVTAVPAFFSAEEYWKHADKPAKVVSMVACFYDLEDPVALCREVASILAPGGVFHIEVADAEIMVRDTLYDGICHEHACYYSGPSLVQTAQRAGLFAYDGGFNSVNGGSLWVDFRTSGELEPERPFRLPQLLAFADHVEQHITRSSAFFGFLIRSGRTVAGYGASTKFNVILPTLPRLPYIADANPEKWGRVTPGTNIPIISEAEMRTNPPDYLVVGPYTFRDAILERERELRERGTRFIFLFPEIEVV